MGDGSTGDAEWRTRVELAACYRLVARDGLDDQSATHISARLPNERHRFLIKAHPLFFDEVCASSLLKVDIDSDSSAGAGADINPAGANIHGAVLSARPEINCVVHTHSRAGLAVAALQCGLLPLCQDAMRFYQRLGHHQYEGMVDDQAERDRLAADLGTHCAMILQNHGLLTAGRSVAEAYPLMRMLERACRVQLEVLATGREPLVPAADVCERTARQFEAFGTIGRRDWAGELRRLEREDRSYQD